MKRIVCYMTWANDAGKTWLTIKVCWVWHWRPEANSQVLLGARLNAETYKFTGKPVSATTGLYYELPALVGPSRDNFSLSSINRPSDAVVYS